MKRTNKLGTLAGASVAALGLALAAAPATAFDEVGWKWHSDVNTDVDIDWEFDPGDIELDNLGMVEDLQIFVGSVEAESEVTDIYNNQPDESFYTGGAVEIPFDLSVYGQENYHGGDLAKAVLDFGDADITVIDKDTGEEVAIDEIDVNCLFGWDCSRTDKYIITAEVDGEYIEIDSFNALTELPEVVSAATAVANNASVEAEFGDGNNDGGGVLIHEGQFAFDVPENGVNASNGDIEKLVGVYDGMSSLNSNLLISGLATSATLLDLLDHSEIEAESEVDRVLNSTVDSAATAVANNFSGELVAEDSSMLIGDVTQFALANVEAESTVDDVWLHDYTNLGRLDRPIANSVATAVGNNKSISVTVGDIDPPGGN